MSRDEGESSAGFAVLAVAVLVLGAAMVIQATRQLNVREDAALRAYTARLDVAATATVFDQPYGYLGVNGDGLPVRWNACEPIEYVVNLTHAPHTAMADVAEAVTRIEQASGIDFVFAGETDELPASGREPYQPERYGRKWAPLLIAWVPLASTGIGHLGDTVGVAVPYVVGRNESDLTIVTAQVALEARRPLPGGFGHKTTWGAVLMHELGHALGLAHVNDNRQIMDGSNQPGPGPAEWGEGDLTGLRSVGAGSECRRTPKAGRI